MEEKEKMKSKVSKTAKIAELEEKNKALEEEILRVKADLINYRKRKDEEVANMIKFANSEFINSILPVVDNFERALLVDEDKLSNEVKNYFSGFKLIYNSFKELLSANGVKEIDVLNKPFDAKVANCLYTENNDDIDDDIVTEVFAKGYTYYDKILRCASVKVNKSNKKEEIKEDTENNENKIKENEENE